MSDKSLGFNLGLMDTLIIESAGGEVNRDTHPEMTRIKSAGGCELVQIKRESLSVRPIRMRRSIRFAEEHRVVGANEAGRLAVFRTDLEPAAGRADNRDLGSSADLGYNSRRITRPLVNLGGS